MTEREPAETTNLDRYGNEALPRSRARGVLEALEPSAHVTWFLGTARHDGRPHAAGVGAMWYDGDLYFTSGDGTRKSRDLAGNPVFEGGVSRVTDRPTLDALAVKYNEGGWPATVEGDALTAPFSAPSAGPPPWLLYRFRFDTVFGVAGAAPHGATKWRFAA